MGNPYMLITNVYVRYSTFPYEIGEPGYLEIDNTRQLPTVLKIEFNNIDISYNDI